MGRGAATSSSAPAAASAKVIPSPKSVEAPLVQRAHASLNWLIRWIGLVAAISFAFLLGATFELRMKRGRGSSAGANDIEVLSWAPRAFLVKGFISDEEAKYVIDLARLESDLKPSDTSSGASGSRRTSSTAWMFSHQDTDPKVSAIVDRMHKLAMIPRSHGEVLAVAKYDKGQLYGWHHDSDERERRLATVIVYLNAPAKGGETIFPFAASRDDRGKPALPRPFDNKPGKGPAAETLFEPYCTGKRGGLKIAPHAGDAVLFFSHHVKGYEIDMDAWHASCPVLKGTKWIMQRWMKTIPMAEFVETTYNMSYADWNKLVQKMEDKKRRARLAEGQPHSGPKTKQGRSQKSRNSDL